MTIIADSADSTPSANLPIRVLLVDDSAVIRGFFRRFIEEDDRLQVVASVADGQRALHTLQSVEVDVIVLDIEMPVMDGLTALPLLLRVDPAVQVIVASTLTKENAVITMNCFRAGAAECLAKPTSRDLSSSDDFKRELLRKVKELGLVTRRKRGISTQAPGRVSVAATAKPLPEVEKKFTTRLPGIKICPDVIAVGSSTGGPQALLQFFSELEKPLRQPVFVTQHMPPTFTAILAEHITKQSGMVCREAVDGETVQGGIVYIAPGNWHMTVVLSGGLRKISLNQEAQESFCRPAVDPMLRSLVEVYGRKVLGVIFTGMGSDGLKGSTAVVEAGGVILAQDETTSVVWGMPGAVAMAGLCTQVLPLGLLAKEVRDYADRVISA